MCNSQQASLDQVRTQSGCLTDMKSSSLSLFENRISTTSSTLPSGLLEDAIYQFKGGITLWSFVFQFNIVNLPMWRMREFRKSSFKTKPGCLILFYMSEAEFHNITMFLCFIPSLNFLSSQTYSLSPTCRNSGSVE